MVCEKKCRSTPGCVGQIALDVSWVMPRSYERPMSLSRFDLSEQYDAAACWEHISGLCEAFPLFARSTDSCGHRTYISPVDVILGAAYHLAEGVEEKVRCGNQQQ